MNGLTETRRHPPLFPPSVGQDIDVLPFFVLFLISHRVGLISPLRLDKEQDSERALSLPRPILPSFFPLFPILDEHDSVFSLFFLKEGKRASSSSLFYPFSLSLEIGKNRSLPDAQGEASFPLIFPQTPSPFFFGSN